MSRLRATADGAGGPDPVAAEVDDYLVVVRPGSDGPEVYIAPLGESDTPVEELAQEVLGDQASRSGDAQYAIFKRSL